MPVIEIEPKVYWVGVNDRTTDLFESLWPITREGVAYNSYLIDDEKKALGDTPIHTQEVSGSNQVEPIHSIH